MASLPNVTSPQTYQMLLATISRDFADNADVARSFAMVYPDRDINDQEIVGNNVPLAELVAANVGAYASEVLCNTQSKHYMLRDMNPVIQTYLRTFDVIANGPDLLKYTLAFGMGLEEYTKKKGERPIVTKIIRVQTLRRLRTVAGITRADRIPPPVVMARKIFKVWNDDRQVDILGLYGTYMVFKTWSLG